MNRRSFVQWSGSALAALGIVLKLPAQPKSPVVLVPPSVADRIGPEYYHGTEFDILPAGAVILGMWTVSPWCSWDQACVTYIGAGTDIFLRVRDGSWRHPNHSLSMTNQWSGKPYRVAFWERHEMFAGPTPVSIAIRPGVSILRVNLYGVQESFL